MAIQLRLTKDRIVDFRVIRDFGADRLRPVADRLQKSDRPPLRTDKLLELVRDALESHDEDAEVAEVIVRQAVSLSGLMRQAGLKQDELLAALRTAIQRDAGWDGHQLEQWDKVAPLFHQIVSSQAVRLVAKGIDLAYEYANLYRRGRIIADVRPLFNDEGSFIEGAVVSFTLRLRFDNIDGDHELSIAMDEADIRNLLEQCEHALVKGRTAYRLMQDTAKVQTFVMGEQEDDRYA